MMLAAGASRVTCLGHGDAARQLGEVVGHLVTDLHPTDSLHLGDDHVQLVAGAAQVLAFEGSLDRVDLGEQRRLDADCAEFPGIAVVDDRRPQQVQRDGASFELGERVRPGQASASTPRTSASMSPSEPSSVDSVNCPVSVAGGS